MLAKGSLVVLTLILLIAGLAGWPLLREAASDDEAVRISTRHKGALVEAGRRLAQRV